jgi:hypothetical protein
MMRSASGLSPVISRSIQMRLSSLNGKSGASGESGEPACAEGVEVGKALEAEESAEEAAMKNLY